MKEPTGDHDDDMITGVFIMMEVEEMMVIMTMLKMIW